MGGRNLFLIRYLSDSRLLHGNAGAVGMVLLCSVDSDAKKYAPLIIDADADGDTIDDFSASSVQHVGDLTFVWVRRDYSGTANDIERVALTAGDPSMPPRAYPIFADVDPLADLTKQGWEVWHRGNFFDEETLTWFFHLYCDPAKAATKDEYPHRHVRVRYTFRDWQLWPEKPEDDD